MLVHAYPGYPQQIHGEAQTPEERIHRERRELGVDHAVVGGVLARRWGLPNRLAAAIERHHSEDDGEEALISPRRHARPLRPGPAGRPGQMLKVAQVGRPQRRPAPQRDVRAAVRRHRPPRQIDPCPLSAREIEVLRRLAEGKVYKQIALELSLSTSTVRTHLHNTYGKLGAVDRAQAVLLATQRGWL